jgi:hypothetical protein
MKSMMSQEESSQVFDITPTQYATFRFKVPPRATMVNIQLIATAPVNLFLQRSEDIAQSEKESFNSDRQWLTVQDLDDYRKIEPGIWYLIVEGVKEPSRGLVKLRLD